MSTLNTINAPNKFTHGNSITNLGGSLTYNPPWQFPDRVGDMTLNISFSNNLTTCGYGYNLNNDDSSDDSSDFDEPNGWAYTPGLFDD